MSGSPASAHQSVVDKLRRAAEAGPTAYGQALADLWTAEGVPTAHEPAMSGDGPRTAEVMLNGHRFLHERFTAAMPDFHYDDVYARVVGDVVYLFFNQAGTFADGTVACSPLCTRLTIRDGRIVDCVLAVDPATMAPLTRALAPEPTGA